MTIDRRDLYAQLYSSLLAAPVAPLEEDPSEGPFPAANPSEEKEGTGVMLARVLDRLLLEQGKSLDVGR